MLGPALYDKGPTGAIPKPGKDAIVSNFPPVCGFVGSPARRN
jgi:hypothetical protein